MKGSAVPLINKNKTFVKKANGHAKGTKRYELHKHSKATLGSGNVAQAVKLPAGESKPDWLAVHVVDFLNQANIIYGAVADFCTEASCPEMSAGPEYVFLWSDPRSKDKAEKVSANTYVLKLFDWIQSLLDSPAIFPPTPDKPFPKNFEEIVSKIFQRLFRVYAHIYKSHFAKIVAIGAEATLNSAFKHFYLFSQEFKLLDPKKDCEPLKDHIAKLK